MTTGQTIEQEIQAKGLTAPRVTPADIEANIASEYYFTAAQGIYGADHNHDFAGQVALDLLTFCVLVLKNGFTVTGESACASPENFDAALGRRIARANAVQKIWVLMGYALKDQLSQAKQPAQSPEDSYIYKEKVEMIDKELVTLVSISKKGGSEVYKGIGRANSFAQRKVEAFKAFELDKPTPKLYQWSDVETYNTTYDSFTKHYDYSIRTKDGCKYTGQIWGRTADEMKQSALDDCNHQRNNT